jgi:RNA polymerase sigma factor (sigma-70 family)
MDDPSALIDRARAGDRAAQDELVRETKDTVYNLAVRMLGNPADAEDAAQEILLKLVTRLESFRGESAFRTWAYRVAANHLLTTRKRAAEARAESFEALADLLDEHLAEGDPPAEQQILINQAKLICTSTMLTCLDRDHRIAYILGEILELPGEEAAAVISVSGETYRKRLSRARARMESFMASTCGLVDQNQPCRCSKQAARAVRVGAIDPARLDWACHPARAPASQARVDHVARISQAAAVFRSHPSYIAPDAMVARIRQELDASTSDLLQ